ncbi:MFS transporter [Streptomyces sp. NPDC050145]|uniref:MFS transporter n=1 Tax=Streptomyces sp. NPDC050145 TaxID=3365602 RepID=UPI0037A5D185
MSQGGSERPGAACSARSTRGERAGARARAEWGLRGAAAIANADWYATAPLLAVLVPVLRTDVATLTLSIGGHLLGHGIALPVWGRLVDRFGARRALRAGLVVAALALAGSALCATVGVWIALRTLTGAAFAVVTPVTAVHYGTAATGVARQQAFATLVTVSSASAILAPLLIGTLDGPTVWRLVFAALALLTAGSVWATWALPEPALAERPVRGAGAGAVRHRRWCAVAAVGALEGATLLALPALLAPALTGAGVGGGQSAVVVAYGIGVFVSSLWLRHHVRLWAARSLLGLGGVCVVGASLVGGQRVSLTTLIPAAVLLGVAWSYLHTTLQAWLPRLLPEEARGTAASVFATSGMLSGALSVALAAPLLTRGMSTEVFTAGAVAGVLLTVGVLPLPRRCQDRCPERSPLPRPASGSWAAATAWRGAKAPPRRGADLRPAPPVETARRPLGTADRTPQRLAETPSKFADAK